MPDYRAVLFDLDGTLLDSMDVWETVDIRFLKNRGIPVPSDYVETLASLSFRAAAVYTAERFSLGDSPEALMDEWYHMAAYEYGHSVRCKPFAVSYLLFLKEKGFKLGVVTDLPQRLYAPALINNGMDTLFDAVCGAEEAARGKPSPEGFLLAARRLCVVSSECAVFEDTLQGVMGAKAAGMKVFAVYDPHSEHNKEEIMKRADGYMHSFEEAMLLSHF